MAKFITTIELQNPNEADYDTLHRELENESFKTEKHAAKSESYIVEREVFSREGDITLEEVNSAVLNAVYKIGKNYSFFVIRDKHTNSKQY